MLWKGVKEGVLRKREFLIVFTGKLLLLVGNILILVEPIKGFPLDMAMGIPDAFGIMLMVGISKKIRRSREARQHNMAVFGYGLAAVLSLMFAFPCENYISTHVASSTGEYGAMLLVTSVIVFFIVTHSIIDKVTESFYLKEDEIQLIRINEFRAKSVQTLDVQKIQELIRCTAKEWLKADWTELLVWEEANDAYAMTHTFEDGGRLRIPANNAFMQYLKEMKKGLELTRMDESELNAECLERINAMKRVGISMVQPLYDEHGMYAVLVISREKNKLSAQERHSLEMLSEISMDAIRNAQLYTEVYWEARIDALTGVHNRKYLYEVLEELQKSEGSQPVSLALFKLDDFRVFNQVYGAAGGDVGLMKVAGLLMEKVGGQGTIFRYGATEFMLVLPGMDAESAKKLAEDIRLDVMHLDTTDGKMQMRLTVSVGISVVPSAAQLDDECLDKCAKAVYMAQQEGQNCTVVFGECGKQGSISINRRMFREYEAIFRALTSAVDAKDHFTASHSQNVSYYATELAKALNLPTEEIEIIKEAGLLHDIGKIGIPESILLKPDKLSEEEYRIMKTHVDQAVTILHHLSGMEYILPAVLGHHERHDGKGYPRGLSDKEIPISAKIMNIVDSFDAMVSARPYKPQLPLEYAVGQLLKGRGTQFDPELADVFVSLVESGKIQIRRVEPVEKK